LPWFVGGRERPRVLSGVDLALVGGRCQAQRAKIFEVRPKWRTGRELRAERILPPSTQSTRRGSRPQMPPMATDQNHLRSSVQSADELAIAVLAKLLST
jgi:hypothetical protein